MLELWVGSLPVCLAEYHKGKVRGLRLVLATQSHLLTAEASSLQDGPYLPGRTAAHGLVYGYALDASQTPEWLVIPERQQSVGDCCTIARIPPKVQRGLLQAIPAKI